MNRSSRVNPLSQTGRSKPSKGELVMQTDFTFASFKQRVRCCAGFCAANHLRSERKSRFFTSRSNACNVVRIPRQASEIGECLMNNASQIMLAWSVFESAQKSL